MSAKFFIHTAGRWLLWFAVLLPLRAQDAALGEKAKIEALIARVEKLDGAVFIRNGSEIVTAADRRTQEDARRRMQVANRIFVA